MVEISLEKLKEIYYALKDAYNVVEGEIGRCPETETLLKWLRETLSTDEKFMEENSLLVQARRGFVGAENILKVFKNKKQVVVEELAKVFFARQESEFCTGNFSVDVWKKAKDTYVIFKGPTIEKAVETLRDLIERNKKLIEELGPERTEHEQKEIKHFERYIEVLQN